MGKRKGGSEMNLWGAKALGAVVLAAVCVLVGIEIAAMGIERVQGPLAGGERAAGRTPVAILVDPPSREAVAGPSPEAPTAPAAEARGTFAGGSAPPSPAVIADVEPSSFIYRASLWLGDALRYVAKGILRFVAAVFDAVIH